MNRRIGNSAHQRQLCNKWALILLSTFTTLTLVRNLMPTQSTNGAIERYILRVLQIVCNKSLGPKIPKSCKHSKHHMFFKKGDATQQFRQQQTNTTVVNYIIY